MEMLNRITSGLKSSEEEHGSIAEGESGQLMHRMQHVAQTAVKRSGQFVAEHPAICLTAAAAAGIAIGWWVKRK
jgi:ElaB/YqjD/DUF883 family membrane-anchored ribosome-binding protein